MRMYLIRFNVWRMRFWLWLNEPLPSPPRWVLYLLIIMSMFAIATNIDLLSR